MNFELNLKTDVYLPFNIPMNETDLIPKYYGEESVSTWLKLSNIEKVHKTILTKFRL